MMIIKLKVHFNNVTFKRTTEKFKIRMTKEFHIKMAKIVRRDRDYKILSVTCKRWSFVPGM
jgi:hypothetical protein